jgi:hypothetical protein
VTSDVLAELRGRGATGHWLANRVEDFLASRKPLGVLLSAPRPLGTAPRHQVRNSALRAIGGYFKGSISARAREVRREVRVYDTTRWRRTDRHLRGIMPPTYVGIDALLFTAFYAAGGKMPYSHSHLREIIGRSTTCVAESPPLISAAPKRTIRALRRMDHAGNAGESDAARR